jgi:hypothetical protein
MLSPGAGRLFLAELRRRYIPCVNFMRLRSAAVLRQFCMAQEAGDRDRSYAGGSGLGGGRIEATEAIAAVHVRPGRRQGPSLPARGRSVAPPIVFVSPVQPSGGE